MIILKGEIKTAEINSCDYNSITKKWDVEFYNGKEYSYSYLNVKKLTDPQVLDPSMYQISNKEGQIFYDIKSIYVFGDYYNQYWHICFDNGIERDYPQNELEIVESCLKQEKSKNVFEYIKQIANLSDLMNKDKEEKLLAKKFSKIAFVGNDVALAKYLNPTSSPEGEIKYEYRPIFPFGCNSSQYTAVKNAMENQISIIEGPPGTGKTQTILNIIANILLQGKTVQIVSNNNSATQNVYEKLSSSKYDLGFVAAVLGNSENKKAFIDSQDGKYPDFLAWKLKEDQSVLRKSVNEKLEQLKKVFNDKKELADLKQEQSGLKTELEYFNQYVKKADTGIYNMQPKRKLSSEHWMALWQECQMICEEKQKIGLLFKITSMLRYGIWDFNFYKQDIAKIIMTLQLMYYHAKEMELKKEIEDKENALKDVDSNLLDDLCKESMALLKGKLAKKYQERTRRRIFVEDDLWKNSNDFLEEYPVVLSTTFSSRSSLNENMVYDYIIMDEASQIDIATGALALSCARNAVIIGDTKQLPNVITPAVREKAQNIFDSFHVDEGYRFTNSFLQSMLDMMPNIKKIKLLEHYRCHPKIINFCNQKFYKGELIIMTEDKGEKDVLAAIKTVPGNHARGHYSQRQIDVIREEVIPKYVTNMEETGIISPYRAQVKAIEKEFQDIEVSTVHKFQGREKDMIIISTVDDEITDFADDPYLINVAVSRAKNKLMIVTTGNKQSKERNITDLIDYIQYNNFEVVDSKIHSVFDYLYKQYEEERKKYLQRHKRISKYDSENLMYGTIEDILDVDKFACLDILWHFPMNMIIKNFDLLDSQEQSYVKNPATHIDFVIYNRVSKKLVLAIEVDGYDFHKEGTKQAARDLLKDHILELYEIPLLRLKTNGSGEDKRIINKLEEIF